MVSPQSPRRVKQPDAPLMQAWLALAHATAALVASSIALTHWLAVLYHVGRLDADPFDTPEDHDLSYEDAIVQARRRA